MSLGNMNTFASNISKRVVRTCNYSFIRLYGRKKPSKISKKSHSLLEHNCNLPFTVSNAPDLRLSNVICTIGPASRNVDTLVNLMGAGMRIARLNFSHGTHEYHAGTIKVVREAIQCFSQKIGYNCPIAIALDTKGPEIRTGLIAGGDIKATVKLEKGKAIKLTTDDQFKDKCSTEVIYVDYPNITKIVKPDNKIFIDDGLISLIVKDVKDKEINCEIESGGKLGSQKGANLPGIPVDLPAVSEKDKGDLRFGVEQCVDVIFASFIRDAQSVGEIRKVLGKEGEDIYIICKIENQQGLDNIDSIIDASDGIMMARGDLGIEIDPERVFLAQKAIIARCNRVGKVAICATQMLESMTDRPRSTRAEAGDVANAIIDGADCVMLSGETAKGKYPLECVQTMAKICRYAEGCLWYERMFHDLLSAADYSSGPSNPQLKGLAIAATSMTLATKVGAIVTIDCDGQMARLVSRFRPHCPIVGIMLDQRKARQAVLHRAIVPVSDVGTSNNPDELVTKVLGSMKKALFLKDDDKVLVIYEEEFGNRETTIMKTRGLC